MPEVQVEIPTALKSRVGEDGSKAVQAASVTEALQRLGDHLPTLTQVLFQNPGRLRGFINLYLNDTDIRDLEGLETSLKDGDCIAIVPAVAGG